MVLVLSLGLSAYLYRADLQEELQNLQAYLSRSDKNAKPAKDVAVPPVPAVNMSSTTQLPVKADDSLIPEKEVIVKAEEKIDASPAALLPAASPATASTAPVAPAPPAPASAPPAPNRSQDDKAWVAKLPASAWVLQHAAFDTQKEIEAFQATALAFKDGQILKTQRKSGAPYFIVVTGPYATRQEAENLIKNTPAMAKSWLRSSKSLKTQFQD